MSGKRLWAIVKLATVGLIVFVVAGHASAAGMTSSALSIDGSDGDSIDGSDRFSIDGSDGDSIDGSDGESIDGSDRFSIDGSDADSIDGSDRFSIDGSDRHSIDGSDRFSIDGSDRLSIDGSDGESIDGSDRFSIDGSDRFSIDGSDRASIDGSDGESIDGSDGDSIDGSDGDSIDGSDRFASERLLAVGHVDTVADGFISVMGQTVVGEGGQFAGLTSGSTVAIYGGIDGSTGGYVDTSVVYLAPFGVDAGVDDFLKGTVDAVDQVMGVAIVSGVTVDYTALLASRSAPVVGEVVALKGKRYRNLGLFVAIPER